MSCTFDPSLTISIDRTSLDLPDLVIYGHCLDGETLYLTDFAEPPMVPRVAYAPSNGHIHGDQAVGWSYQQTMLNFAVSTHVDTEAESRAVIAELRTAIARLSYTVRIGVSDAPVEAWTCQPGSLEPSGSRGYGDLHSASPEWSVGIPCFPIRSVA